jgi:TetR/AcrR family transcriptional repressor of nem operon
MRVSRQTLAAHRASMLAQAAKLFRGRGIGAVAVADITAAAGMTHGAFYGHFPSKSALVAEAFQSTLRDSAVLWRARADQARADGRDPLATLIDRYLSERHRDDPETGCALASLAGEMVREAAMQDAVVAGIGSLASVLQDEIARLHPDASPSEHEASALAILAAMNGGLVLARALAHDPARSDAVLRATAAMARGHVAAGTPITT